MRILFTHRVRGQDPRRAAVEDLITGFLQGGHDVVVVEAPGNTPPGRLRALAGNFRFYLRLRRRFRRFSPDILYQRHDPMLLAGTVLARRHGVPLTLEVDAPPSGLVGRLVLAQACRAARRVLVGSLALEREVSRASAAARVELVPPGVLLERFPRLPDTPPAGPLAIGAIGPQPGLPALLDNLAAAPDAALTLTVLGARPDTAPADERVRIAGRVDPALLPAMVAGFDIAVQTRASPAAAPAVLAFMAAARPIVAIDDPELRLFLDHDRTALLVDPADPAALWQAIQSLARDPALRHRLGQAARAELERQDWTWRGVAARIAAWADADWYDKT